MGEMGKKQLAQSTDASRLEDRYYRDYADHWRNFVKGVNVKQYKNKADATSALQAFSSANSPMKILAPRDCQEHEPFRQTRGRRLVAVDQELVYKLADDRHRRDAAGKGIPTAFHFYRY